MVKDQGSTSKAGPKPRRGRSKKSDGPVINLDNNDDPFNFDAQVNNHPAPLQNFNVERGNFGDLKFVRSPTSTDAEARYSNTEKAAVRSGAAVAAGQGIQSPSVVPSSITEMTTTPEARKALKATATSTTAKKRGRKPKGADTTADADEDAFEMPTEQKKTPKAPRRSKRGESPAMFASKPKPKIEAPTLTPEEQVAADFADDPYPPGIRVYALWGNEFYPAIVYDRNAFGGYKVIFTEDSATRDVPPPGIIPLSSLAVGHQIAITVTRDKMETIQPVKIVRLPSKENAQEWVDGMIEFAEVDDDGNEKAETATNSWDKCIITKLQQKDIAKIADVAVKVDSHNIVPKSARRSRVARPIQEEATPTPKPTPKRSAAKPKVNGDDASTPVKTEETRTPKKRGRKPASTGTAKSLSPPAKRLAVEEPSENGKPEVPSPAPEIQAPVSPPKVEQLFKGRHFMLTSSARRQTSAVNFNKREYRQLIEERGGIVAEEVVDLQALPEDAEAYLIADTSYRTHKYLYALAASIPCVAFIWINKCIEQGEFIDYKDFLLPAGVSALDDEEYAWKPLKGELLKDKTIFVHSVSVDEDNAAVVPFAEIWRPLLNTLGAEVITTTAKNLDEIVEFCRANRFEVMLTDKTCSPEVAECVAAKGVPAVSSNWIIHAIITGEFADVSAHPSFSPQAQ